MPCTVNMLVPAILSIAEFAASLIALGVASSAATTVKDSVGQMQKVELAFKDALGRDAGVVKTKDGFRIVTDSSGLTKEQAQAQQTSIQQIVQRYAYQKVVKDLQAKGFTLAEEQAQADNTMRLVLRKWS
ncbi:MAG: DUF1257 domain-containing protein [Elusimicrobia bacterium]|nr:DUF1257 domain-containing protein [Elusimicrobiota bacterium]